MANVDTRIHPPGLSWPGCPRAVLGEAPLWNPQTSRMSWVDCDQKKLFELDPETSEVVTKVLPSAPGSYAFRRSGGMIMAFRNRLALYGADGEIERIVETPMLDFSIERFNDGACDRKGRFWVGTMDPKMGRPTGSLYRVDADLSITRMQDGIMVSNGLTFSPDDKIMYHTDSRISKIYAYDFDLESGAIANRRIHLDFAAAHGRPDGCTIDEEGYLWVAVIERGAVVRFAPDGSEVGCIDLPVSRPTSVMFGGGDLRTLYITTMMHALSREEIEKQPLAGCLLSVRTRERGLPESFFGG